MKNTNNYRPVLYYILAFAVTWINGFILIIQSMNRQEKNIINLLIAYMGPFIAAVILGIITGKDFRRDFIKRIFDITLINVKYLPLTLLLAPAAIFVSIVISILLGQPEAQLKFAEAFKVFDGEVVLSMIILALVPVLEELGWRGYGIDSLTSKMNLFKSSMIFASLWGIWHLPVFFMQDSYQSTLWAHNPVFAVNFFAGIFPLAVIMNYLFYKNNRSIILVALFHILVNYSSEIFEANQISKCIFTVVLTFTAAIIVINDKDFFFAEKMNLSPVN